MSSTLLTLQTISIHYVFKTCNYFQKLFLRIGRYYYDPYFIDEETEVRSSVGTIEASALDVKL